MRENILDTEVWPFGASRAAVRAVYTTFFWRIFFPPGCGALLLGGVEPLLLCTVRIRFFFEIHQQYCPCKPRPWHLQYKVSLRFVFATRSIDTSEEQQLTVRSRVSSRLIFASSVGYFDRAYNGFYKAWCRVYKSIYEEDKILKLQNPRSVRAYIYLRKSNNIYIIYIIYIYIRRLQVTCHERGSPLLSPFHSRCVFHTLVPGTCYCCCRNIYLLYTWIPSSSLVTSSNILQLNTIRRVYTLEKEHK